MLEVLSFLSFLHLMQQTLWMPVQAANIVLTLPGCSVHLEYFGAMVDATVKKAVQTKMSWRMTLWLTWPSGKSSRAVLTSICSKGLCVWRSTQVPPRGQVNWARNFLVKAACLDKSS